MGVVNVTPDSFSDGGLYLERDAAIAHGEELVAGRGGDPRRRRGVDPAGGGAGRRGEELRRVEPVVAGAGRRGRRSRSTRRRLAVAEAALDAGATIVNDVTALRR